MSLIGDVADEMQVSADAVRLLLTVYLGYVMGVIHRKYFFAKSVSCQNAFFATVGLSLLYWNYGMGVGHSVFCIVMQWLFFRIWGTGRICVAITFIFQLGYISAAYFKTATEEYDFTFTIPHSVLMLRLIGLCWDVYDGHRDETKMSTEQQTLLIKDVPSLLEIFAFCYFYGGFMIGPQFPLRRFRQMVNGELSENPGKCPHSLVPAFRRFLSGTVVLVIQTYLDKTVPQSMLLQPGFLDHGFLYITTVVCFRGQIVLLKYISIWMVNEGVCILCGLGYYKEGVTVKWDGVHNVRLWGYLTCRSFQQLIQSFNISSNQWIARYIFKRLRFLGNRTLSHVISLIFIAIWHGYHEGYFTVMAIEFVAIMVVERSLGNELRKTQIVKALSTSKSTAWVTYLCGFLYFKLILGYCHLDFVLKKWRLYSPIQLRLYCYGHVFCFICWITLKIQSLTTKSEEKSRDQLD